MSPSARLLLRRIALGLPIATAPIGGAVLLFSSAACTCGGPNGCGTPYATTMHAIDSAQHARLFTSMGAIDGTACRELCLSLDVYGPGDGGVDASGADGGVDAGGADGGLSQAPYGSVTCTVASSGGVETVSCAYAYYCIGGRAPSGLAAIESAASGIGGWLARAAHLERASVDAFEDLAGELALHGAPDALVRLARRSADDERRHATRVGALASEHGAVPPAVRRTPTRARSLEEIATDNAVEGCVREAYAALVAAHQARSARDADVRAAYEEIAADEARHALFSFALHDWARAQLAPSVASEIEERRLRALEALSAHLIEPEPALRDALGLPTHAESEALLAALA